MMKNRSIRVSVTKVEISARFSEEPTDWALNKAIRKPVVLVGCSVLHGAGLKLAGPGRVAKFFFPKSPTES